MTRWLHSILGLFWGATALIMGLTGALLSLDPALDRLATTVPTGVSVAQLAGRVARHYPGVEQIQRTPSGTLIVYYSTDAGARAVRVDPADGTAIAPYAPSTYSRWLKQLHRSLLLDTPGRMASGLTAVAVLGLCISGSLLLIRRAGGWRHYLGGLRGNWSQRWHAEVGRVAIAGLLLSALTGIYLSGATFGFVPDGMQSEPDFPAATSGGPLAPVADLAALRATDLAVLRELVFPLSGDPGALYTLRTAQGDGYVDQSTGALLSYRPHSNVREAFELVYRLHTGDGLWWLGLLLGCCALSVPWLALTGTVVWSQRRRARPRVRNNSKARSADIVILVGSENNSTWGFAQTLHDALRAGGRQVHAAPMNQFSEDYDSASDLLLLTATYGDGDAPATADRFLAQLERFPVRPLRYSVLGFGDRQFPRFCHFAREVDAAMNRRGWRRALDLVAIDRQSPQEFARWGGELGRLLGITLVLEHVPRHPPTCALRLAQRIDYGLEEHEPTVVLRFAAAPARAASSGLRRLLPGRRLPAFEAGDLVGVIPPGSAVPRFYSLASGARDGILEICVRRQSGGLCSGFLHSLRLGDTIEAFILPNPQFRPSSGSAPVILIGAGTGIGPLAGFIRNNSGKYPMYLYWGGRDPVSDFLYEPELRGYLADRRLTQLHTAFSRVRHGARVQTRLTEDAENLRRRIGAGGQVLVCGSRAMAESVRQALNEILAPIKLDVPSLKRNGKYREDVF